MPIDFSQFQSQKVVVQEVKKITPEVEISTIQEVKKKKIVADRIKNKTQLAKQIHKLFIDDTKRPKNQQKIVIEKYRSTLNDLKHIVYTPNTEIETLKKKLNELQKTQEYLVENGLKVLKAYENCKKLLHYNYKRYKLTKEDLDLLDKSIERSKNFGEL